MDEFPIQGLIISYDNDTSTLTVTPKKGDPVTYVLKKNNGVTVELSANKLRFSTNKPISEVTFTTFYALRNRKLEANFMVTPAAKVIGFTDFEGSVISSSSSNINLDVASAQFYIKGGGLNIVGGKSKLAVVSRLGKDKS
ncbi:MAG: hypothetical protein AAF598_10640 [Bacteroidota bacterium]